MRLRVRRRREVLMRGGGVALSALLIVGGAAFAARVQQPALEPKAAALAGPSASLARLEAHIERAWDSLTRSRADLLAAARDPKLPEPADGRWPVYVSRHEPIARVEAELAERLPPGDLERLALLTLPERGPLERHGLLYLPRPYVVPGGRFNEMYGWDSYFIQLGLLRSGRIELARDLVDNFVYQIEHYGTILNANRTYYLTRSQPPFLGRMILGVFEQTRDVVWLRSVRRAFEAHYRFWTTRPHLLPGLGLSRYYDTGEGPAPEVIAAERDERGRTHYDRVRDELRRRLRQEPELRRYYDARRDALTARFYKGDRSMRESGYDPSDRFGPFGADVIDLAPVCLNSLLYLMETDGAAIASALGDAAAARGWQARASERRARIARQLWDAQRGMFLDYDVRAARRRDYPFATTFMPLWVGAASPEQAARVRAGLGRFEAPGGVVTSTRRSGNQWDAPFGWAPLQLFAVEGLRRYGYQADADRLARRFLGTVAKELDEHDVVLEKYDVCRRESDVAPDVRFGYSSNEVGFGWTNGVALELIAGLGERGYASVPVGAEAGELCAVAR